MEKNKIPLDCFENGKGVFLLHPRWFQLARFLQTWNENPLPGDGENFRSFLARGDWGFLCDSLQLSLGWDRSGQAEEFLRKSVRDPLLLSLSKCQGPWGPVTIMLCLLLATEVSCLLMLLGGNCFFLSLKTQSERKKTKRTWEKKRGGRAREGWIDRCLFRSSWKTQWSEKPSWLVSFSSFFPRVRSGEGGMEKKERKRWRTDKAWAGVAWSLRVGDGKVTWWFWDPLGSPPYWPMPSFHKRLWLRVMLPVVYFERRKTQ